MTLPKCEFLAERASFRGGEAVSFTGEEVASMSLSMTQKTIVWVIDIGFIVYWSLIILRVLPPEVMFEGYDKPEVQAWNWSFLPLDIAASVTGIVGQTTRRLESTVLLTTSLVLTSVAGGMALVYWVVLGYFDIVWWAPNLVLFLFPLWPLYYFITNPGRRPLVG